MPKLITEKDIKNMPAGGALIGKREGQTIIHKDGSMGGYLTGKLHKNNGIKAVVKTDGRPIEMQGAEVVITAPAVADQKLHDFNGRKMTQRQILSEINVNGGGVAFAEGGPIPKKIKTCGKKYDLGGKLTTDTDIVKGCGCKHSMAKMASGGNVDQAKKLKEAIAFVKKLKAKDTKMADFELTAAKVHPEKFLQMVSDQTLGYVRKSDGSAELHSHGGKKAGMIKKYGKKLVETAIELYPAPKPVPFLLTQSNYKQVERDFLNLCQSSNYQGLYDSSEIEKNGLMLEWGKYGYSVSESAQEVDYEEIAKARNEFNKKYGDKLIAFSTQGDKYNTVTIMDFKLLSESDNYYEKVGNSKPELLKKINAAGYSNAKIDPKIKLKQSADKKVQSIIKKIKTQHGFEVTANDLHHFEYFIDKYNGLFSHGFKIKFSVINRNNEHVASMRFKDAVELFNFLKTDEFIAVFLDTRKNETAKCKIDFNSSHDVELSWYYMIGLPFKIHLNPFSVENGEPHNTFNKKKYLELLSKWQACYTEVVINNALKMEDGGTIEGFTDGKDLNKMFVTLKSKYGDKKGSAIYEVANRLVNPNKNTIIEIRSNGVVVKEVGKYILKPFGNTDSNIKKWTLYKGLDVTDQFADSFESGGIADVTLNDLDKAKKQLADGLKLQDIMKKTNAIIKAGKDVTNRLIKDVGLSEKNAIAIQEKDFAGRVGFPSYKLTNNNANNKRLQERVNALEQKVKGAQKAEESGEDERYEFDKFGGGHFIINYEADRVQIFFNDKQGKGTEGNSALNGSGWNWSFTNSAWQRKITPAAISNAKYILSAKKVESETLPAVIESNEEISEQSIQPKFKVGDYVTYQNGDVSIEDWYGIITKVVPLDGKYAYRVDAFNIHHPKMDMSATNEVYEVQLTPIKYATYAEHYSNWQRKAEPNQKVVTRQFKNMGDYKEWIEETRGRKLLDLTEDEIIDILDELKVDQLVGAGTKRNRVTKAAQMLIYQFTKNVPDNELTLEQYAIKKFIGEAFTEAMMLSYPLQVFTESYRKQWDKIRNTNPANSHQPQKEPIAETVVPADLSALKSDMKDFTIYQERLLFQFHLNPDKFISVHHEQYNAELKSLEDAGLIYKVKDKKNNFAVDVWLTEKGKVFVVSHDFSPASKALAPAEPVSIQSTTSFEYFKGIDHQYENPFQLNKAIEEFIDKVASVTSITAAEKVFISYYSGYGGLEKFGATGKGLLFEYFTPKDIVKKMWALAYHFGYKGGTVLEPACGAGEFIKFAPDPKLVSGYEINEYSYKVCKLLYPEAHLYLESFETNFIKNRSSIKGKIDGVEKFDLVIGNPPYGDFTGLYAGMGEKSYTRAENYIDYFIFRGLDKLVKGGLLIFIIGTEVANGGKPWLDKPMNAAKKEIMDKSDILDAYRLPNGVFERTDVLCDIIVLRKK